MRSVAWLPAWRDACALYRMFIPSLHTPNSLFILAQGRMPLDMYCDVDVSVVQRIATKPNLLAIQVMKKAGMKLVFDLDDNIWSIPRYNPAKELFEQLKPGIQACSSECDVLTVSTQALKVAARKYMPAWRNRRIEVIPNSIDFDYFPERRKGNVEKFVVAWAGSNTHSEDIRKVFALIPSVLEKEPDIHFQTVGQKLPETMAFNPRISSKEFVPVSEYAARLSSWDWDLLLAPLEKNEFNHSKSNIKILEAAAIGSPILVSDVGSYGEFMRLDSDLRYLLCSKESDWRNKIIELKHEPGLRNRLVHRMRKAAREHFDAPKVALKWREIFESL